MAIYRFDDFVFDSERLELRQAGRMIALRPKAAALLRVLLEQRGHIVPRRELLTRVWHTDCVQAQCLFQTVSELRRKLSPLDAIRTHPNIGYEWRASVHQRHRQGWWLVAAVVALALGVGGTWSVIRAPSDGQDTPEKVAAGDVSNSPAYSTMTGNDWELPPALRAFSAGLEAMRAARISEARRHFSLALQENPDFAEARLLMAETLLTDEKFEQARMQAGIVLASRGEANAYAQIAAMHLLSRTNEQRGDLDIAMRWASAAVEEARSQGFACTLAQLEDRVRLLLAASTDNAPGTSLQSRLLAAAEPGFCAEIDDRAQLPAVFDHPLAVAGWRYVGVLAAG